MKQEESSTQQMKQQVYSRQQYAKANFWDERYSQKGGFFDWYAEYPELKNAFFQYAINKEDRILMVGCGNSKLSGQMYKAGYTNIVNIDIAPSVIEQMKAQFPQMVWQVMDATKMSYKDGEFDVVMDKGTLDALISGKNYEICTAMLRQSARVMKQTGQILLITYGSPEGRKKIFESALPFQSYDYYQCRAELNDISTMINLMRSNLGGQKLNNILKDTVAFAKTMKEFSIIKMMRRNRKNTKQFIVWSGMQKAKIQVNPTYVQEKQAQPVIKSIKKEQKQSAQPDSNTTKVQQPPVQQEEKQSQKQQFTYQPRKQSYVYVYSIRPKFVTNLQQVVGESSFQQLISQLSSSQGDKQVFAGNQENTPLSFCLQKQHFVEVLKAAKYLKEKGINSSRFTLNETVPSKPKFLNVHLLLDQKQNKIIALRKTNFSLKIKFTPKYNLQKALQDLSKLSKHLTSVCNLHPCPKTYALFHVLKNRNFGPSVNSLLQKFWFPTYAIKQVTYEDIELNFSIPPIVKQIQAQITEQITKYFKPLKVVIGATQRGYLSYIDLQLVNIVSMGCLSYSNKKVDIVFQQFWQNDELNQAISKLALTQNQLYYELENTIALPKEIASKVVAHMLAFY